MYVEIGCGLQLQHSGHIARIHVMANMYQMYCTVYKFHKTDFLNNRYSECIDTVFS